MVGDQNYEAVLAKGIELHDLAVQGQKGAAQEALQWLDRARLMEPDNPEAQAYYGSALALAGRDSIDPQERFAKVLRGLKILDRTVAAHGDLVRPRVLRAYVTYRLPEEYFYRTQTAIEDFRYLIDRYEQDSTVFGEQFYWQLLSDLAKAYMNIGKGEEAKAVQEQLEKLRRDGRVHAAPEAQGIAEADPEKLPDDMTERAALMEEGLRLLSLGEAGDHAAAEEAYKLAKEGRSLFPQEPVVEAFYASSYSLLGRYASDSNTMFAHAVEAIEIMENAVRQAPENIELRKIRADHSYRLPEAFFRRTAAAITDFEYLAAQYRNGSKAIDSEEYHRILYRLGDCYLRLGMTAEAKEAWDELLNLQPGSPYASAIREQLNPALCQQLASPPEMDDIDDLLEWGLSLFHQGLENDPAAAEAAKVCLEKVHQLRPEEPWIEAYYGSALALTGRYSSDSTEMFQSAVQGLAVVSSALRREPKNPEIRLLRGYLCFGLPEPLFHMTKRAIEDLQWVKEWYLNSSRRRRRKFLTPHQFVDLLVSLQSAYRRLGQDAEADALALAIEAEKALLAEN